MAETGDAVPDDADVMDAVEAGAEALRDDNEDRGWLRVIKEMTATIYAEEDMPHDERFGRVRFAYDQFLIAAFERASRILRSDLPDEKG